MKDLTYYCDYGRAPRKEDFTKYFVYGGGKTLFSGTATEFNSYKNSGAMKGNPLVEKGLDDEAYRAAVRAHGAHQADLLSQFKADLLADNGVSGPKADRAYSLAWEYGHSAGLSEVVTYFEDLVDLIK